MSIIRTMVLSILRVLSLSSRFVVSVFIAREFGVGSLGEFGIVSGCASFLPAALGFGLNGIIYRSMVTASISIAVQMGTTKILLSSCIYVIFVLLVIACYFIGFGSKIYIIYMLIFFSEHILGDVNGFYISRGRPATAGVILAGRNGFWPIALMLVFYLLRPFEFYFVFVFWLASNIFFIIAIFVHGVIHRLHVYVNVGFSWLVNELRSALVFYIYDVSNAAYLYLDRLVVGALLGLEAAGVYSLFSSVVNSANIVLYTSTAQPFMPDLILAAKNEREYKTLLIRISKSSFCYGIVLTIAFVAIAYLYVLFTSLNTTPIILSCFLIMMISLPLRCISEVYHLALYSISADWAMTLTALAGMTFALALSAVGALVQQMQGVAASFFISAAFLLLIRAYFFGKCYRER